MMGVSETHFEAKQRKTFLRPFVKIASFQLRREKTFLWTCTTSKDSDETAHPRSLISVFAVRVKHIGPLTIYRLPIGDSGQAAPMCRLISLR